MRRGKIKRRCLLLHGEVLGLEHISHSNLSVYRCSMLVTKPSSENLTTKAQDNRNFEKRKQQMLTLSHTLIFTQSAGGQYQRFQYPL
jgi:hypothetical protein